MLGYVIRRLIWAVVLAFLITFVSFLLFLLLAVPIGLLSALYPRSFIDKGLMFLVLIGISCHPLWLGLVLSYFFGFRLHWFPVAGYCDFLHPSGPQECAGPKYWAYHMIL